MKWALIHQGSDIMYGLMFFAGELLDKGHSIHWFDGDNEFKEALKEYDPHYVCFGPLSSEFEQALSIATWVKGNLKAYTVFGGHHVKALPLPSPVQNEFIDYVVWGPCYGVIDQIIDFDPNVLIPGEPIEPGDMVLNQVEYFDQIPRIGNSKRKFMMSHFGCVYNCSFCCTGITREAYGTATYKKYWLNRRPVDDLIKEALVMKKYGTTFIAFNDDDVLYDTKPKGNGTKWLTEFAAKWKKVNLPLYVNVTPITVLRATDEAIDAIVSIADTVQMGLETSDKGSKKLFNRVFQSEEQIIKACKRLVSRGLKVKFEIIVGLPNINGLVPDPVEDAIHSVEACQRIADKFPKGSIKAACNNLVLFPGTALYEKCKEHKIPLREGWKYSLYEGIGSVIFTKDQERQLKNIVKMTVMFVKFGLTYPWIKALIDMEMTDESRRLLSQAQWVDSIMFRTGEKLIGDNYKELIKGMTFKY
jgi:radical SAM superfamily enzyme YgiQ (UPF0313 family)